MYGLDRYDVMRLSDMVAKCAESESDLALSRKLSQLADSMDEYCDILPLAILHLEEAPSNDELFHDPLRTSPNE